MITRYMIPALAVIGLIAAILFSNEHGSVKAPEPNQLSAPPIAPFEDNVSGLGIVEANSRNIEIGSPLSGIVDAVLVKEGDRVEKGAPLFRLDARQAVAETEVLAKEVQAAEAAIDAVKAALADEQDKLARIEKLKAGTTVSEDRLQRGRFAVRRARANLNQMTAQKKSTVARYEQANITLDQHTVNAPIAARVLKTNISAGEFITANAARSAGTAPVLLGADNPLHIRVAIDENDVWRFTEGSKAQASLRSNKEINFPLTFVRVEPYVQPKVNLNGDQTERVDTRVLEVIYSFNPTESPVFIGQQMDVFIEGEN